MKQKSKIGLVKELKKALVPEKAPTPIQKNRKKNLREIAREIADKKQEMRSLEEILAMKHASLIELKREFNKTRRKAFMERLFFQGLMFCSYCQTTRKLSVCQYVMERSRDEDAIKTACHVCIPPYSLSSGRAWNSSVGTKIYLIRRTEPNRTIFVDGGARHLVPNSVVDRRVPSELPEDITAKLGIPPEEKI